MAPCSLDEGFLHQSYKDGLIVGFAFSFTSAIVAYMSFSASRTKLNLKRTKNNRQNKTTHLDRYICSIMRRKTRIAANQIHELLPLQLQDRGSERVLSLLSISFSEHYLRSTYPEFTYTYSVFLLHKYTTFVYFVRKVIFFFFLSFWFNLKFVQLCLGKFIKKIEQKIINFSLFFFPENR